MDLTLDLEPGDDVVYVAEAVEQIERIERGLLQLEQNDTDDDTLGEIFRAAHTLKGSAATIGHSRMAELTHALENVFGALRSGTLADIASFDDLLLRTVDVLRVLVDEVAAGHTLSDAPGPLAHAIAERLSTALAGGTAPDAPAAATDAPVATTLHAATLDRLLAEGPPGDGSRCVVTFAVDNDEVWSGVRILQGLMAATETGRLLTSVPSLEEIESGTGGAVLAMLLHGVPAEHADLVARLRTMSDTLGVAVHDIDVRVPTVATTTATTATTAAVAAITGDTDGTTREASGGRRAVTHTVRVDVVQLDDLMNLVGELVVQKTRLRHQARQLVARGDDVLATEVEDGARQFAQIIDRLQAAVTKLRMMPIETVFSRFPRLVRDLSAQLGKDIGLTLDGGETELDRSLLEEVGDPLAHLIRNALDHGIESGPDRITAGKPEQATIRVSARQSDGRVMVEVADDGRGMDPAAIVKAALERGLIDTAAAAALSEAEALRLVFLPGFSTAREVTNVSGRGVGMDVVLTNVERLGGQVSISSILGTGTTVAMSLPLTLAIIEALLVRSGRRICAIPLRSVLETHRMPRSEVRTVATQPVLDLPRGVVPLQSLFAAMGDPDQETEGDGYVRSVLVRSRGGDLALAVDEFLGTEEIVLKSLGLPGDPPTGVVGATILADGGVALVVDVDRLVGPDRAYLRSA